jgi:hypothetical protein
VHVRVVEERLAARDGEVLDEVDLVALERVHHRRLGVVEDELHPVGVRLLAPVGVVADEGGALLGRELLELERPRALERLPPVGRIEIRRDDDRVVVRRADERGEVAVRRVEVEDDRRVVGRLDVPGREHAAECGLCVRGAALGVDQFVEGRLDVVRRQRGAAVELDALPDLERPGRAVLVRLPALGELWLELELLVREREELAGRPEQPRAALVLDEEGIRGRRRLDQGDADVAAGLDRGPRLGAQRPRAAGFFAAAARRGEEREERDRHADDGAAADEFAARDLAARVLVDEVVLELTALPAKLVDAALRLIHMCPLLPLLSSRAVLPAARL